MTIYAKKVDANQKTIVELLRKSGFSVEHLHTAGSGIPDLLVGYNGLNYLIEVKDGDKSPSKAKLNQLQEVWHREWKGQVIVIKSIEECLKFVNEVKNLQPKREIQLKYLAS